MCVCVCVCVCVRACVRACVWFGSGRSGYHIFCTDFWPLSECLFRCDTTFVKFCSQLLLYLISYFVIFLWNNSVFHIPHTPPARVVISLLAALIALPFVFVSHWLIIVIFSYISLFSKPARKQKTLKWPTWYKYKVKKSLYGRSHLSSFTVSLTELGWLSESRLGPTKKGHSSVKCRKKAGRSPTLQLVRVVYEASHHKLNLSLYLEIKQENAVKQVPPNIYFWKFLGFVEL